MSTEQWKNRIVGLSEVDPRELQLNPRNAREHGQFQRRSLTASIDSLGLVAPATRNKRTGRLVDGHARVKEALRRGEAKIPVIDVDLSEAAELQFLATFDAIGALATANRDALDGLLQDIEADGALAELLERIAAGAGLPAGGRAKQGTDRPRCYRRTAGCPAAGQTRSALAARNAPTALR